MPPNPSASQPLWDYRTSDRRGVRARAILPFTEAEFGLISIKCGMGMASWVVPSALGVGLHRIP